MHRDRRDAPKDEMLRPAKCFAFVQAHDEHSRRRLLDALALQGRALNQRHVLTSDSCEWVRRPVSQISPEAEHVLVRMTKGACPADQSGTEARLRDLSSSE